MPSRPRIANCSMNGRSIPSPPATWSWSRISRRSWSMTMTVTIGPSGTWRMAIGETCGASRRMLETWTTITGDPSSRSCDMNTITLIATTIAIVVTPSPWNASPNPSTSWTFTHSVATPVCSNSPMAAASTTPSFSTEKMNTTIGPLEIVSNTRVRQPWDWSPCTTSIKKVCPAWRTPTSRPRSSFGCSNVAFTSSTTSTERGSSRSTAKQARPALSESATIRVASVRRRSTSNRTRKPRRSMSTAWAMYCTAY
mmetsp:Transcript_8923/g.24127  ORF Transcript_8923/g.24127 Transcript_8923/m.24127 type:complete len:254 (-) Transcript_8923:335-1096(-)